MQPFKGNPVGLTITSIPSLGSEANKTLNGTVNAGIYVRKGATLVKIGVYPPAKNAALRAAVTAALGRL